MDVAVVPVVPGVYMLQGAGGNIGLSVGRDDAFVIDDQYAPLTPKIQAAIASEHENVHLEPGVTPEFDEQIVQRAVGAAVAGVGGREREGDADRARVHRGSETP